MDSDLLVEKVADGERLSRLLKRADFDVRVMFWAKESEDSSWRLWIASSSLNPSSLKEAIAAVYDAIAGIRDCSIGLSEFGLLEATDPKALAAAALRDRVSSREPLHLRGRELAGRRYEELVLYPTRLPLEVRQREGNWEVRVSEMNDEWLACDSEVDARTIATAHVLEYEALAQTRLGDEFAAELERTADVLQEHRMRFGARRLRRFAQKLRLQPTGS